MKNIISQIEIKKPWSKMTKVEKRKSIAKDVIFNVRKKIIEPANCEYGMVNFDTFHLSSKEFQSNLKTYGCKACAMGALMAADIINRNNRDSNWMDYDIIKRFEGLFSEFQLRLIETAFEGCVITDVDDRLRAWRWDDQSGMLDDTEIAKKAIKFGNKYEDSNKRLIAIMNNIIKDPNGLFLGEK